MTAPSCADAGNPTAPARPALSAAYVRELRLAVKDHAMTPEQFQHMVGLVYVPFDVPAEAPITEEERALVIETLSAWRAAHTPV